MNAAHLHLALNHIPVVGFALAALLLIVGLLRRSESIERTSVAAFVVIAVLTIPAYLTGEPAEDIVKTLAGVSEAMVESHEEASQIAFTAIIVVGVFALVGLGLFRKKQLPQWFAVITLMLALTATVLVGRAANLGGQIRHPEIISGNVGSHLSGEGHD
jgi:hypothetical protein